MRAPTTPRRGTPILGKPIASSHPSAFPSYRPATTSSAFPEWVQDALTEAKTIVTSPARSSPGSGFDLLPEQESERTLLTEHPTERMVLTEYPTERMLLADKPSERTLDASLGHSSAAPLRPPPPSPLIHSIETEFLPPGDLPLMRSLELFTTVTVWREGSILRPVGHWSPSLSPAPCLCRL